MFSLRRRCTAQSEGAWKEDDDRCGATMVDRWCYSTSRRLASISASLSELGLPVTVVRYFNIYGPRLDKLDVGRLFTIFMGQLLRGADLTVAGMASRLAALPTSPMRSRRPWKLA